MNRLEREALKAQRLQNAQSALELASPAKILEEMGLADQIMGGRAQAKMQGELHPLELERQAHINKQFEQNNAAQQFRNDNAQSVLDREAQRHHADIQGLNLSNELQRRELDGFDESQAHERAMREKALESAEINAFSGILNNACLLYTSPSPRDLSTSRMPSSA